ncbi:helix-turn-helix domain-containing protein [Rhizosphaericola mali]|uniref:Helix-turn-helix transcriptional regulator n=1 Tax=Rhizosphaericola mali TaxID=2545455 RepID=A0A5P2GBH4_9BACT|nr:AraC family transcriptional regulator [Rhizosphaericola mali]QES88911.1 helix-turn-helix transcriptional regulator [Rhizosphaericola mali]
MELLFEFKRRGDFNGVVKGGIVIEDQLIWTSALKYHVSTNQLKVDVQKILHISPGVHLYLLTYETYLRYQIELTANMDMVVITVQLRGKSRYHFGNIKSSTDQVSGQYSLYSIPPKKLLFSINEEVNGQILLIFMPKDYVRDFALHYPNAKYLVTRKLLFRIFPSIEKNRPFLDGQARSVATFLLDYLRSETRPDTFIVGLTIKTFLSLLLNPTSPKTKISYYANYSEEMEKILLMLSTDLSEFPGIRKMSRMLHINTTTFKKMFSLKTGTSPLRYWHKMRMEKAHQMLLSSNLRPSDIADYLGYSSLHAFDKAFKKHFGIPPTAIIQKDI